MAQKNEHLQILEHHPGNRSEGVDVFEEIYIRFSRPQSLQNIAERISISPKIDGRFITDLTGRGVYFKPNLKLQFGQKYTVQIENASLSHKEISAEAPQASPLSFHFRTAPRDTTFLQVTDVWPHPGASDVSTNQLLRIEFNRPVIPETLVDNESFFIVSKNGERTPAQFVSDGATLTITPVEPLLPQEKYLVTLLENISDISGIGLRRNFQWTFSTKSETGHWRRLSTKENDNTIFHQINLDDVQQKYQIASVRGGFEEDSRITEVFIPEQSTVHEIVMPLMHGAIPISRGEAVALAVSGDSSFTDLFFLFSDGRQYFSQPITIDWKGWKRVIVDTRTDSLFDRFGNLVYFEGEIEWLGVILSPLDKEQEAIQIRFGEMSKRTAHNLFSSGKSVGPAETFALLQSFPNPMKAQGGTTRISFDLPENETVSLSVFDVLGRQITKIVDTRLDAGVHTFLWDGLDDQFNAVPAGVYFLRLVTGRKHSVLKLSIIP